MRCLLRNQQRYYYALYLGSEDVEDGGEYTGDKVPIYSDPVEAYGNISADRGEAYAAIFGTGIDYDNVIVTESTELSENAIVWFGVEPSEPHNYIVRRISPSLNSVAVAIKRVDVGA